MKYITVILLVGMSGYIRQQRINTNIIKVELESIKANNKEYIKIHDILRDRVDELKRLKCLNIY